jgi:U32 family peptidase
MSPAGYWPQLNAAVEAGADAVYFGLHHFTARAKVGFDLDELPQVMRTLHSRGVRGYLTFNTLVFDSELRDAIRAIERIADAGTDAMIVQDVGVAQLIREIAPDIEIHGSTQMSITSAEGVAFAQRFGVSRVVLARELSLDDIRLIRAQTNCELEMFVHGALCVSYSGQCFSSEAWGGRSANRGKCAQACRLPYDLIVDGAQKPLDDARYLLSPGDLYALEEIPSIIPLGVSSLKIEGRYKESEYVALTTAAYRKAVDEAWAGRTLSITPAERLQLEQVYSRGLGPWFVSGTNHQTVVDGRAPRHRGVLMGKVVRVFNDSVLIEPGGAHDIAPLKPGDGVVLDAADWRDPSQREEGGPVFAVAPRPGGYLEVGFKEGTIKAQRVRTGDLLWRTADANTYRAAKPYLNVDAPVAKQPVALHLVARVGQPPVVQATLVRSPAISVTVTDDAPLQVAGRQPLTAENARAQLDRLGQSAYAATEISVDIAGDPFVPVSLLNQLRRQALEQIAALQVAPKDKVDRSAAKTALGRLAQPSALAVGSGSDTTAELHALVRTPEQLETALSLETPPSSITLDYLELYGLRPAVERIQRAGIRARVASPRVLKPNEERVVNFLARLECDVLVRSSGLLHTLTALPDPKPTLIGDFSLNAANAISARSYLEAGLSRLTPTYDLNAAQIADLAARHARQLEVVAYMHLPVFHMEHCVFCRFMSTGTSYKDCGHPCEKHRVALRDKAGRLHPVMADVGCRNTVFGAEAQEISGHLDDLRRAGVRHYRVEFVHEDAAQAGEVLRAFQDALAGRIDSRGLHTRLKRVSPMGVTEGSYFVPSDEMPITL